MIIVLIFPMFVSFAVLLNEFLLLCVYSWFVYYSCTVFCMYLDPMEEQHCSNYKAEYGLSSRFYSLYTEINTILYYRVGGGWVGDSGLYLGNENIGAPWLVCVCVCVCVGGGGGRATCDIGTVQYPNEEHPWNCRLLCICSYYLSEFVPALSI